MHFNGRSWEHSPTGPIKIARDNVKNVDEPLAQTTVFLYRETDAAVRYSRWCTCKVPRQLNDRIGRHAGVLCNTLRRPWFNQVVQSFKS